MCIIIIIIIIVKDIFNIDKLRMGKKFNVLILIIINIIRGKYKMYYVLDNRYNKALHVRNYIHT